MGFAGLVGISALGVCLAQPLDAEPPDDETTVPAAALAYDETPSPTQCTDIRFSDYDRVRSHNAPQALHERARSTDKDDPAWPRVVLEVAMAFFEARDAEIACRSLDKLVDRYPEAEESDLARCLMTSHCEPPLVGSCPDGFGIDEEHGCTAPQLNCDDFEAGADPACEGDAVRCCVSQSIAAEFEMHEAIKRGDVAVAESLFAEMVGLVHAACEGGEALSCLQAARIAAEPRFGDTAQSDAAFAYLVRACDLGHVEACERIKEEPG